MIMVLSKKFFDQREALETFEGYLKLFAIVLLVVVPVALQHDMGTAALTTVIAFLMFFFAEVRLSYLAATAMTLMTGALGYIMINPYQQKRIVDYVRSFGQSSEPVYQLKQSLIALAQGGILGQGIGESKQKYLFLPEAHNDFIFSMIGEEYGLIGTVGVLILFVIIIHRGILIAQQAPDGYGRNLAAGITACIGSYALINAGVALGVLPTTGIPMPFLSYGGTAIVTHLGAMGLLLNISAQSSPAFAQSPGWRAYKDRLEKRVFSFPMRGLIGQPRVRRTSSVRMRVR
jgi:cell division protein FtsW